MLLSSVEESTSEDKRSGFHLEKCVQQRKHGTSGVHAETWTLFLHIACTNTPINTKCTHSHSKAIQYSYTHALFIHLTMINILSGDKRGFAPQPVAWWCNLLTPHGPDEHHILTRAQPTRLHIQDAWMCSALDPTLWLTSASKPSASIRGPSEFQTHGHFHCLYSCVCNICKIKLSFEWNLEKGTQSHFNGLSKEKGDRPFWGFVEAWWLMHMTRIKIFKTLHQSTLILPFTYNPVTLPCVTG